LLYFERTRLNFGSVSAPYRNELDSLRAENERLRGELAKKRVSHPILALMLAGLDVALVVVLRPWLNGTSDGHFWAALTSVGLLGLAAAAAALGRRQIVA
jgi:hypothetical protein